jgi:hypothetical protein
MGFLLSYIAIILFVIVYLLDEIILMVVNVKNRKWFKTVSERKYSKAFAIDVFGNYLFPATWNVIFSNGGYSFGRFGESLSSALGRKFEEESLSIVGLFMYGVLYIVDYTAWGIGGHCFVSIMSDETIDNFIDKTNYKF